MLQKRMIESFREKCHQDERIVSALMFGSFTTGEGDRFSDIEFAVFLRDESFDEFEQRSWLDAVSPVAAYFLDDFGHHTALFENGIRGEFHFMRASEQSVVASWQGYGWFPSLEAGVVLDRAGELSRYARGLVGGPPKREGAELVEGLALNLINLMLLGANLLNRGEHARAWALLGKAHESLLKLARLCEGKTDHWPTPSRGLETDLCGNTYRRYLTCTASAERVPLCRAYCESWRWSKQLMEVVAKPYNIEFSQTVMAQVDMLLDSVVEEPSLRVLKDNAQSDAPDPHYSG